MTSNVPVLVGHPYAPIGMGEHIRCSYRAFRSAFIHPLLLDIYRLNPPEADFEHEFADAQVNSLGSINIFHINGDEVAQALEHLPSLRGFNIIYPAWELAKYPDIWAKQLNRFDEIWAPSRFIQEALSAVVERPVLHMPLACEVVLSSFLGRRYFKIPESSYTFLFFFDFRSYLTRKNPHAVIEAYSRLVKQRPNADTCLVIKLNGSELFAREAEELKTRVAQSNGRIKIIDGTLSDNEIKNLVRCCDCFISLHRSEGFGRGMAEAMYLGKPVISTGYSGNMDFMNQENAFIVDYGLVALEPGAYPHWEGQSWADPDVEQAAYYMQQLVDDPSLGYRVGRNASTFIRMHFSYRAAGNRYSARVAQLLESEVLSSKRTVTCRREVAL